ncbi:MAG: alkaline phosphatase D family protein, partial [Planctomycetota bacterium]
RVIASRRADLSDPIARAAGSAAAEDDFTCVIPINGLKPNSKYHYGVKIDDGPVHASPQQWFRTFDKPGSPVRFTLAFGGGAGFVPDNERMWDTIDETEPDLMFLLGDNVYIDDPESVEMQQYTYHRRQSRPEWRRLVAHTPVFTIWDDHDFSTNDSWGGPRVDIPFWKRDYAWTIFKQNWVNPGYGGGYDQPGCWYAFAVGDVDFIMLDCRYYRTDPRGDDPSMLGPVQIEWLKRQLAESTGTFKVICSSVPWDYRTKGDSRDTWNGYRGEREDIFGFIEDEKIEGVVLMSADRHRSDAWRIKRPNAYDFYEFNSSRLTNQHVHGEKSEAIFSYNKKQSFGHVTFDTTRDVPRVTYEVITIDGEPKHSLTVQRDQLQ